MNKRKWEPKTKAEIVLGGLTLSSDDAIAKLCQIHGISVKQYRQWEKDFINNAERVFAPQWDPKNQLSPQEILMVWQHFANIGGHDKDRMVNIMMFLSPLLFATIGYAYTKQDKVAAMIGVFTSLIAVVVVLMYSGYADRNWSHADRIAETYLDKVNLKGVNEREGVVNNPLSWELKPQRFYDCGRFGLWVHKLAAFLSRPHDPQKSLAPIFQLFLVLSVITALVSLDLWVGWLPYLRQVFSFNNTEMLKPVTDIVVNVMNNTEMLKSITDIVVNLFTVLAIVVGAVWARYKFWEFRESKFWVQLDIEGKIFKLNSSIDTTSLTWDRDGQSIEVPSQKHTHAVEVALIFNNKGKTRVRLFNIQLWMNTMRSFEDTAFNKDTGELRLKRIFTSGNIVPFMPVERKPPKETSFYYIEPGVQQVIRYLALISEPRELLKIAAKFSFEEKRIFPERDRLPRGLYPHTASVTYQLDEHGKIA